MNPPRKLSSDSRLLESVVAVGLTVEDMYISNLQTKIQNQEILVPEKGTLQDTFIYNSGNLFNGYYYSLIADWMLTYTIDKIYDFTSIYLSKKNPALKLIDYIRRDSDKINITSGILSSLAIGFFETTGFANTPDLKDIPAGVAGALLHTGLRYLVIRNYKKKIKI